MHRLTLADVELIRRMPGRSLLLFLTDRCPVGCAHCSVDSRSDSPSIRDFALFEGLLETIASQPKLTTVGISGGEPFVERRGLTLTVDRLRAAGKDLVLYTSGVWANPTIPAWIPPVLRQTSCVFLSTDGFHAATIDDDRFVRAAQTIAEAEAWIVVQVLAEPDMVTRAEDLLVRAFGAAPSRHAELNLIPPLPYGRGAALFGSRAKRSAWDFAPCRLLAAPVVRYDGIVGGCCNEQVIMGRGPQRLRLRCYSGAEATAAIDAFRTDPVLNVIARLGGGPLTCLPQFTDLADRKFGSVCELCWAIQARALSLGDRSDRLVTALAAFDPDNWAAALESSKSFEITAPVAANVDGR